MLTIAALFPIYVFAEIVSVGGGGPISAFLFGVVLMNYAFVTRSLNLKRRSRIDRRKIREYHDEIAFLMKALFFVYLGIIVKLNPVYIMVGGFLTALIFAVRFITATVMGKIQGFPDEQVIYTRYFFIQGAGSLVMSQFVTKYDPNSVFFLASEVFTNLVVPIVLISIFFTSVMGPFLARKQAQPVIHVINERIDPKELDGVENPKSGKKNGRKS
jgi:NhaP-type Na+/H+ or K+/H+ antiporter